MSDFVQIQETFTTNISQKVLCSRWGKYETSNRRNNEGGNKTTILEVKAFFLLLPNSLDKIHVTEMPVGGIPQYEDWRKSSNN